MARSKFAGECLAAGNDLTGREPARSQRLSRTILRGAPAGQGTSAAAAMSISTAVANATASVFVRALSAIQILQQENNAISMAVSNAIAQAGPTACLTAHSMLGAAVWPADAQCLRCRAVRDCVWSRALLGLVHCSAGVGRQVHQGDARAVAQVQAGQPASAVASSTAQAIGTAVSNATAAAQGEVVVQGVLQNTP